MLKLQIKFNGKQYLLDTNDDLKLNQVILNPAFSQEAIWNIYSYPGSLPLSDANQQFFKLINDPAASVNFDTYQNLDCILFDDEIPILYGYFTLTELTESTFEYEIKSNASRLVAVQDTLLKKLDLGGSRNVITEYQRFMFVALDAWSSGNIGCYVNGVNYFTGFNTSVAQSILDLVTLLNAAISGFATATATTYLGSQAWIIQMNTPGGSPRLSCTPSYTGDKWLDTWFLNTSWYTVFLEWQNEANDVLTKFSDQVDFAMPPVRNRASGITDESNPVDSGDLSLGYYNYEDFWMNPWSRIEQSYWLNIFDQDGAYQSAVIPMPYAFYVLKQIAAYIGLDWSDLSADHNNFQQIIDRLCMYNNRPVENDEMEFQLYFLFSRQSLIGETYNLQNHVPDKTIKEFLSALMAMFNAAIHWDQDNRSMRFVLNDKLVNDNENIQDISRYLCSGYKIRRENAKKSWSAHYLPDGSDSIPGEVIQSLEEFDIIAVDTFADLPDVFKAKTLYWVTDERLYYASQLDFPFGTVSYAEYSKELTDSFSESTEDELLDINPDCDSLIDEHSNVDDTHHSPRAYPVVSQELISHVSGNAISKFDPHNPSNLRFLLYHGIIEDADDGDYPFGSSQEYDWKGNVVSDFNLVWNRPTDNERCLIPKFYQNWLDFLLGAKEVECYFDLDALQLSRLKLYKKVLVNNIAYLIKEINVAYPITEPVLMKLVRVANTQAGDFVPGAIIAFDSLDVSAPDPDAYFDMPATDSTPETIFVASDCPGINLKAINYLLWKTLEWVGYTAEADLPGADAILINTTDNISAIFRNAVQSWKKTSNIIRCDAGTLTAGFCEYDNLGIQDQLTFVKTDLGGGTWRISCNGIGTETGFAYTDSIVWTRLLNATTWDFTPVGIASAVDHIDVTAPGVYGYGADHILGGFKLVFIKF